MGKINRLRNVKLNEISFVGKGDNPEAHVLLLKVKSEPPKITACPKAFKDDEVQTALLKQWIEDNPTLLIKEDGEAVTFAELQGNRELRDKLWGMCYALEESISSIAEDESVTDKTAMISQSIDQFKAAITAITKGENDMPLVKMTKERDEALVQVDALTKENDTLKAACAADKKKMDEMAATMKKEESEDPIYKGLPEAVITKMKNDTARIEKMEDDNLTREYIGKAAEVSVVGEPSEIGSILKSVAKHSTELADKLFGIFKTSAARIKEGDLLKEKGSSTEAGSVTAYDKMVAKAAELRKSCPELTPAQAFTKIYDTDVELRKEYEASRQA